MRIPLSGLDRLKTRNYYTVHLYFNAPMGQIIVEEIDDVSVSILIWNSDDHQSYPASIPTSQLADARVEITQYYKTNEIRYKSALRFIAADFLHVAQISYYIGYFRQSLFNTRTLARKDRAAILTEIYEEYIKSGETNFTIWAVCKRNYGERWIFHPQKDELINHHRLLLNSLCESGELAKNAANYTIKAKTITTLSQMSEDERRHKDQINQQKTLGWLTLALVVVGLIQIFSKP
ncbi:hypothetical protein [Puniceibacterium antarcticum]|nr:hypothetical protein [Puniceibacterium antarcticum]